MSAPLREPSLAEVTEALQARYPLDTAEPWDAVGLVCGDPDALVRRVLWTVDPTRHVVEQAITERADLIVAHHPLLLTPVSSVAATTPRGKVVHRLIESGIALYTAHTNADVATPGVSDALAAALGLVDVTAIEGTELGRRGRLATPETLDAFARRVLAALPATAHGVRVLGDRQKEIVTVAVCGGSGDSLLPLVSAAGIDAYVTADLKHHRALDHREGGGCAVVDVAHWASEWPWLEQGASLLRDDLQVMGATVDCRVSRTVTDPWSAREGE